MGSIDLFISHLTCCEFNHALYESITCSLDEKLYVHFNVLYHFVIDCINNFQSDEKLSGNNCLIVFLGRVDYTTKYFSCKHSTLS